MNGDGQLTEENDERGDWVFRSMKMDSASGGLVWLVDFRATQERGVAALHAKLAHRATAINGEEPKIVGAYAVMEPMEGRLPEGGDTVMGGVYLGAWGSLSNRFQPVKEGADVFGRWVAGRLRGKDDRKVMAISCYRAPGLGSSPGGLVARELLLRGWPMTQAGAKRVEEAFFEELGSLIAGWRAQGYEIILMGDLNITERMLAAFQAWCSQLGLVNTRPGWGGHVCLPP